MTLRDVIVVGLGVAVALAVFIWGVIWPLLGLFS